MKMSVRTMFLISVALFMGAVQAQSKYGATAEDSVSCVQNLSLYQEFMKQEALNDA